MESGGLITRELRRYQRQIAVPEIGVAGQEKLKKANILVVGAGGLGCPVLQYLAAAGVGKIGIVEFETVNESDLHRQILYGSLDVGRLKSIIVKDKINLMNDLVTLEIFNLKLESKNALDIIRKYDLVIDATNDTSTNYLINDSSVIFNKPMVHGSVIRHVGQVSVFNHLGGPTYRCYKPFKKKSETHSEKAESGLFGVLPGITGAYMATEAVKIITGLGDVLSGKVLYFNIIDNKYNLINIDNIPANHNISALQDIY
jgi:molybdopterin/thiamine biosynthesis adenylyltransferase